MNVVILGASGLLARSVTSVFAQHHNVSPLSKSEADVTNRVELKCLLKTLQPDVVISTAAFMNADRCEQFPEQSYAINAVGARHVSHACQELGALCVWFSSDFVFNGQKAAPYHEHDSTNPLMTYGMSKLAGEHEVRWGCADHYIIRSASYFADTPTHGGDSHFVARMLTKARAGETLKIVDDVIMSPTYVHDLARMLLIMVERSAESGLYHITNEGQASWYELCCAAFSLTNTQASITPIQISRRPEAIARRPISTPLVSLNLPDYVRELNRPWQDALKVALAV